MRHPSFFFSSFYFDYNKGRRVQQLPVYVCFPLVAPKYPEPIVLFNECCTSRRLCLIAPHPSHAHTTRPPPHHTPPFRWTLVPSGRPKRCKVVFCRVRVCLLGYEIYHRTYRTVGYGVEAVQKPFPRHRPFSQGYTRTVGEGKHFLQVSQNYRVPV